MHKEKTKQKININKTKQKKKVQNKKVSKCRKKFQSSSCIINLINKMYTFAVTYFDLATELIRCGTNVDLLSDYIKSKNSLLTKKEIEDIKSAIQKRFLGHFSKRLQECARSRDYFFKKNESWLKSTY